MTIIGGKYRNRKNQWNCQTEESNNNKDAKKTKQFILTS